MKYRNLLFSYFTEKHMFSIYLSSNIYSTAAVSLKIHKLSPYISRLMLCESFRETWKIALLFRLLDLLHLTRVSCLPLSRVYEFIGKMYCKWKISCSIYTHIHSKKALNLLGFPYRHCDCVRVENGTEKIKQENLSVQI
jgi:hypothetical protein